MPVYKVKVKWGKENFPAVELDTDEQPILFKAQLFALTGVQPERQKVMLKGKIVNEDSWQGFQVKDGTQLLLVGAADEIPSAPTEKIAFVEDMNENELCQALQLPAGLSNLGNTCYLNAVIQCIRTVTELRESLEKYTGSLSLSELDGPHNLTVAIRDVMQMMDREAVVTPILLVQVLHMLFPRFAEKSEQGGFVQQDANECWVEVMRILQQKLPPSGPGQQRSHSSIIDQYFGGSFRVSMKNSECDEEPESFSSEEFLQLSCFISSDVKYLHSGLRSRLHETITKHSATLQRDAVYNKSCKISRLPAYLSVQFVRFQYKERASTNAKILKDIKFPVNLDVFELCSPELQEKLLPMRAKFKAEEDLAVEQAAKGKQEASAPTKGDKVAEVKKDRHPFWFPDDVGSNNSGFYQLQAVLTHKGRSSSSGHYLAWIRRKENEWFKCDDEEVTPVSEEEILKLSGGGDWHTAYVLLYGPRVLETTPDAAAPTAS